MDEFKPDFSRTDDESDLDYIFRICAQHESIGSWDDVAHIINAELGRNSTESCYRKAYAKHVQDVATQNLISSLRENREGSSDELRRREETIVRLRDQCNDLRRMVRNEARQNYCIDMVRDIIALNVEPRKYIPVEVVQRDDTDTALVVHLTDVHAGLLARNFVNTYDENVMNRRLAEYAAKVNEVARRHNASKCYVVLGGDMVSGIIHSNLRLENNMHVIQQVKDVSEAVCYFLSDIAQTFTTVDVFSVSGNHGRVHANKDEALKGENLDSIVLWYAMASMKQYDNIRFHDERQDESFITFEVNNKLVVAVHGDKDTPQNVVQNLTMMLSRKPAIVLMGHRHTNNMKTVYDTKVIESGCVSGSDNFAIDHRLSNKPEQTITVVTSAGVDCIYDVTL